MNMEHTREKSRSICFKLVLLYLTMLVLGSFWLTVVNTSDAVRMVVIPQIPKEGEPVIATFRISNPLSDALITKYQFYINGQLWKEGTTTIDPRSSKTYKYAYENPIPLGEALTFLVRTKSAMGQFEESLSSPPYPPQVWSSFVSFASFSTSLMSSMSSMTYYQSTFGAETGFNLGLLFSIVLIVLLIFLELTQPLLYQKDITILGRFRLGFATVTWILLIIFMGIVYTKVVMIIAS